MADSDTETRNEPLLGLGVWRITLLALIVVTRVFWRRWEFEYGYFFAIPATVTYVLAPVIALVDAAFALVRKRSGEISWTALLARLGWAVAIVANLVLSFFAP